MKWTDYPMARQDGLVTQDLADEVLVYDLNRNKVLCLDRTTASVWRECDGTHAVADIGRSVSAKHDAPVTEPMVWMAVEQLKRERLLADNDEFITPLAGLSRREMVRRIGLASAVVLPTIFEVTAPSAALAQSVTCGPIGNCTSGSTTTCICTPIVQPGANNNPDGCRCATNGDCQGNCQCGNPCTGGTCPVGETCQSGVCRNSGGGGSLNPCNGSCPVGTTCITDSSQSNFGSCSGVCPASPFNFCVGAGTTTPICIPNNGGNLSALCCPCTIDGDCAANCSNNNVPGVPGVCVP